MLRCGWGRGKILLSSQGLAHPIEPTGRIKLNIPVTCLILASSRQWEQTQKAMKLQGVSLKNRDAAWRSMAHFSLEWPEGGFIEKGKAIQSTTASENRETKMNPMRPSATAVYLYSPDNHCHRLGMTQSRLLPRRRHFRLPSQILPPSLRRIHHPQTVGSACRNRSRPTSAPLG